MQWTEEQKRVIEERGSNILVSAAAGSGKTAVLCERIIERLTDSEAPLSLDRLLVMTFTRAAAEEMRDRISRALLARMDGMEEGDMLQHLRRQRLLLKNADISTIDSLCSRLIKEYYQELDIDPGFRTAEEGELKVLRADVLSELLEECYASGDRDFMDFAESFSSRRSEEKLSDMIESAFTFIQGDPWPEHFLKRMLEESGSEAEGAYEELPWFRYLLESIRKDSEERIRLLEQCLELCSEEDGPQAYGDTVSELMAVYGRLAGAGDYTGLYGLMHGYTAPRLKAVRGKDVDPWKKDTVKQCIDSARDRLKALREELALSPELLGETVKGSAAYIRELALLTSRFMERYEAEKRERGIVDFNDMEHLCLRVLYEETEEGMRPSAIADELAARYDEILVDEYQDSNLVQEALLQALSAERFGRPDVFMVGDVKQSIYRFRLAKPELFMSKYHSYGRGQGGIRIDLNRNFRSLPEVIASVNDVFSGIMGEDLGGIDYDDSARLWQGAAFDEDRTDCGTELLLLETGDEEQDADTDELEATLIAARIRELVNEDDPDKGFMVTDREHGGLRPASYKDIAILLRAPGRRADTYVDVLNAHGIPAYTESSHGYFSAPEVETMLACLSVIDNPRQDIELAAVMRSTIGGFSDEELARIRIAFDERLRSRDLEEKSERLPGETGLADLYEALRYCAGQGTLNPGSTETAAGGEPEATDKTAEGAELYRKCSSFLSRLMELRELSDMLPVNRLLDRIYAMTGYYDQAGLLPLGRTRRRNLDMLLERAEAYGATGERSLSGFVRYIEMLKKYDTDYGEAGEASGAGDTVRIISIHRSKGLEYPIVILANMAKLFNREDRRDDVLMDSELGMGADYIDTEKRIRYPGLKRTAIKQKLTEESLAEELRILYVAMTRAREKLIMTAAAKNMDRKLEKLGAADMGIGSQGGMPSADRRVPRSVLLSAGSLLDLVLMSGAMAGDSMALRLRTVFELQDIQTARVHDEQGRREALIRELLAGDCGGTRAEAGQEERTERIRQALGRTYRFAAETGLPPKVSVSELKRAQADYDDDAMEGEGLDPEREVLPLGRSGGGTAYGNAFHRMMQLLSLADLPEGPEIGAYLTSEKERIRSLGLMSGEELYLISDEELKAFLLSDTAKAMAAAARRGELWREQRFMATFPADELMPEAGSHEPQLLQGIVDAFYADEAGELSIVDYKTDRLFDREAFIERYGLQLELYRRALQKLTSRRVRSTVIYSTAMGCTILCTQKEDT